MDVKGLVVLVVCMLLCSVEGGPKKPGMSCSKNENNYMCCGGRLIKERPATGKTCCGKRTVSPATHTICCENKVAHWRWAGAKENFCCGDHVCYEELHWRFKSKRDADKVLTTKYEMYN